MSSRQIPTPNSIPPSIRRVTSSSTAAAAETRPGQASSPSIHVSRAQLKACLRPGRLCTHMIPFDQGHKPSPLGTRQPHGEASSSLSHGPSPEPLMYAMPTLRNATYNAQQSQDTSASFMDCGDAASINSHSPLHTPHLEQHSDLGGQPLSPRTRFDSAHFPHPAHKVKKLQSSIPLKSTDFAEKQRELPHEYHTPPAFSRQSSGWNTASDSGGYPHPYGSLGGPGSKSDASLQFAEGDYGKSKFARFWLMVLNQNTYVRWMVFILPVLLLLWIPGICGVTINPSPRVWQVELMNWSIWLSIAWLGELHIAVLQSPALNTDLHCFERSKAGGAEF